MVVADSPYNHIEPLKAMRSIKSNLIINDCTLREGEQAALANFSLKQKLEIAGRLIELGIHQLQVGYPGRSQIDQEVIRAIRNENKKICIETIAQIFKEDWMEQIDAALSCQPDILDLIYPSSDLRLRYVLNISRDDMMKRVVEAIQYAKGKGAIIRYAPVDTTRTEFSFLKKLFNVVLEAGAERISVADTAGATLPQAMAYLVREIVHNFPVPVHVHCHNDFGLALANTLAAVEAGATIVDATVNGLGERAGNVCIEELVVALKVFYNLDLEIDTKAIGGLSRDVARMINVNIPPHKPLLGELAFAHKLDAHVWGVLVHSQVYEVIPPEMVSNVRRIPIGTYTGDFTIRMKLKELNLEASDEIVKKLLGRLQDRIRLQGGYFSDQELVELYHQVT